jgi:hypothetical protein
LELVLAAIPEGWAIHLADAYLTVREVELLKLAPGHVRELIT